MEKTTFAGLTVLDQNESTTSDGGSFVGRDRETIDFYLQRGAKTHRHTGLAGMDNPLHALSANVINSGGSIPGDISMVIGYTLQDGDRGETVLSPLASVSTPGPLPEPTVSPVLEVDYTTGDLTVDSYYYGITYVDGNGGETPLGPTSSAVRTPGFPDARILISGLTASMPVGATGWRLYRMRSGGDFAFLAAGTIDTYTDDGTVAAICDDHPPSDNFNTTNAVNSLEIELPDAGVLDDEAEFINVYLSDSGDFSGNVFLEQYPIASAGATVVFTEIVLLDDQPPDVSTSVGGPPKIDAETEIDWGASGYPGGSAAVSSLTVEDPDESYGDTDTLIFAGGAEIAQTGAGEVTVTVTASGGGGSLAVTAGGAGSEEVDPATRIVFNDAYVFVDEPVAGEPHVHIRPPMRDVAEYVSDALLSGGVDASGSIGMNAGYRLLGIDTDKACRIRLYGTEADRDADIFRPLHTEPTGDHGLYFEFLKESPGFERINPIVEGANFDNPTSDMIPLTIDLFDADGTVTLDLTWVPTEHHGS